MRAGLLLGLAALLVMPTASALTPVTGHVDANGSLYLPPRASVESTLDALFVPDASTIDGFSAHATTVHVQYFSTSYVEAPVGSVRPQVSTGFDQPAWDVDDARITLTPSSNAGWLGLHPQSGTLASVDDGTLTLQAATGARLGNGQATTTDETPDAPYFDHKATRTVISFDASAWNFTGTVLLKTLGPTVRIESRENSTTLATGASMDPTHPGQTTLRWVVLTLSGATVGTARSAATALAFSADVAWHGAARVEQATGKLDGTATTWTTTGTPTTIIDGDLRATVAPGAAGNDITLDITGNLHAATMTERIRIPTAPDGAPLWPLALVVGIAIASAGGYAVAHKRRRAASTRLATKENASAASVAPDDYAALAERAADADDYAQAAKLAKKARALSPTSRRLALDHAYYESKREGGAAAAWAALMDPLLADDPDAAFLAMQLHLADGDTDAAAAQLIRALALAPLVLLDVERDAAVRPLLARADVQRAVAQARRALG